MFPINLLMDRCFKDTTNMYLQCEKGFISFVVNFRSHLIYRLYVGITVSDIHFYLEICYQHSRLTSNSSSLYGYISQNGKPIFILLEKPLYEVSDCITYIKEPVYMKTLIDSYYAYSTINISFEVKESVVLQPKIFNKK